MIGWRTLGRVAVGSAVFLVAVSIGVVARGGEARVIGLDPLTGRPLPSPTPTPTPTPTGGTPGCDPRAHARLRPTDIEVATVVRYVVGVAPPTATDPPSPAPIPVAVAYPAVRSGVADVTARRINADVRRRVTAALADVTEKPPKDGAAPATAIPQPSLDSSRDHLLSVRVELGFPGAKNIMSLASTYDLSTGRRVELQGLFPAGKDCRQPLCRAIAKRLVETPGRGQLLEPEVADAAAAGRQLACPYLDETADGAFDTAFMVEPDGLALLFGPCRIVACAGGVTVVTVPFGTI